MTYGICPNCGTTTIGTMTTAGFVPGEHVCTYQEQKLQGNYHDLAPWQTNGYFTVTTGISLRDYFAGLAMQGILVENSEGAGTATFNWRQRAEAAYKAADAMLKAREVHDD